MDLFKVTALATLLASASSIQAFAHTSFVNPVAEQESTIVAALQVPHGCDGGLATTEVRMVLPEGFIAAKPQPKAGWELEIISGAYQKAYDNHGTDMKSGPVEIRWKGGNLPDAFYDTFNVRGKVSGIDADVELPFKVTQLCGATATAKWDEIAKAGQDSHSLDNPAPTIKVVAKKETAHAGGHDHGTASHHASDVVKVGNLELSGAAAKAMLPGQPVGGGFVTIKNEGSSDDRLVAVETPLAGRSEIHEMAMVDNVMKMRKLGDGIAVPAGKTVELSPGGLHFMFFNVKKPFAEGDMVPATLTFEKAGKVDIMIQVGSANGEGHSHNHN